MNSRNGKLEQTRPDDLDWDIRQREGKKQTKFSFGLIALNNRPLLDSCGLMLKKSDMVVGEVHFLQ